MKKLVLLFSLFVITTTIAQKSLEDYKYVIVPNQFDFVSGKDTYQLNSMTKFYLNKQGFNAYFNDEAPNLPNCEGLFADVLKDKAFLRTKLYVVLKDCKGNEVYRGRAGSSKYKEWKKAYQDALRSSFDDFVMVSRTGIENSMAVSQETSTQETAMKDDGMEKNKRAVDVKTVEPIDKSPAIKKNEEMKPNVVAKNNLPEGKFTTYVKGGRQFLLKESSEGFAFYEKTSGESSGLQFLGKVVKEGTSTLFIDLNENRRDVYVDKDGNMTIFNGDVPENYKVQN